MKSFGNQEDTLLNSICDWLSNKLSFCIGRYERTKEVVLFIPTLFKCVP